MKNVFKKSTIVILVVVIVLAAFYTWLFATPISYGMGYHNVSVFEEETFESTMTFYRDGTVVVHSTNFEEVFQSRYYYQDGYVFFTMAETEEDYALEIAAIQENFEEAVRTPFYADKINAFRMVAEEDDGYATTYNCTPKMILVVAGGFVGCMVIAFVCVAQVHNRKAKRKEM